MKKKAIEALKIAFFVGLGLFLAWLSLRNIPIQALLDHFKTVNPLWLGFALVLSIVSHIIRALRWNMLLEPSGFRVKPMNAIMAVLVGYFINLALPRTGEVARCGLAYRYDKVPVSNGVGTVVAERVVDMIFLLILFILSFLLGFGKLQSYIQERILNPILEKVSYSVLAAIIVAGILALVAGFLFLKKRGAKQGKKSMIDGFIDGLKSALEVKKPIAFILSSLAIWVCYYLVLYIGFLAYPPTKDLGLDACLAVFVFGTIGMIVTPGGIGAYPALVGQTLVLYGVDETAGVSFGWIIWGAQTLMFILLGPLSLIGFPVLNRSANTTNHEGTIAS